MKLTGNTILITGGTSGIGRALAVALHARGNTVIVAGRRQSLLDEIAAENPGMHGVCLDVQDPEALRAFVAEIEARFPSLNVLVNNAGISRAEDWTGDAIDTGVAEEILLTNVVGVLRLTAALLPLLKRQTRATVVTTTSNLAFLPRADFPTYCASKAFLHSWLQSMRTQLRETSVEVLELSPPYVQTELTGEHQLSDPRAMPLDEYVAEVMAILESGEPPRGEILVERGKQYRFAERDGTYEQVYAATNGI